MAINNSVKMCAAFLGGVAIGFYASYKYNHDKFEAEKNSYVQSVINSFDTRLEAIKSKYVKDDKEDKDSYGSKNSDTLKKDLSTLTDKIEEAEYVDYTDYSNEDTPFEIMPEPADEPYVVSPNDYASATDFDNQTLYYFSDDDIVTDTDETIIDNYVDLIGPDALNHFGEYEEDSVIVRNEKLRCDYEIILNP